MSIDDAGYERLAEFHDLFMDEPWQRLGPYVRDAFAHLGGDAVVVEVGAGTGMGTRTIAREMPARIVALEPALVMRAVLTARMADDTDLASRVTVVAGSAPGDLHLLPDTVDGFVCAHMLGHLERVARRDLLAWLGSHLNPGGVGLVTTQQAPDPGAADEDIVEVRRLGDYEYRALHLSAGRAAAEAYTSRYEVWHGETRIRDERFSGSWRIVGADDIAADLPPTLRLEPVDRSVALIRPRAPV
ncbi:class I SAM-dependent methyltransferase [Jiangella ureilytica]|nr:class I SAM-dependent methyltransferase [Jiangella ureilytica]